MSRPHKQVVDYFSHDADASSGRTLSILFNHFGHEGISAWWQLLEIISTTENHVIDCRNPEDREFLSAKMRFSVPKMTEILDKMAYLGAIDQELYGAGFIWCQKLVDRLEIVYKNRRREIPVKPLLVPSTGVSTVETMVSTMKTPVSTTETPQSKVKESKVKESKGGTGETLPLSASFEIPGVTGLSNQPEETGTVCNGQEPAATGEVAIPSVGIRRRSASMTAKAETKDSFESYAAKLRGEYPDFDDEEWCVEMDRFRLFYDKRPPRNDKLALFNWMKKAREIREDRQRRSAAMTVPGGRAPQNDDPDRFISGKFGGLVRR